MRGMTVLDIGCNGGFYAIEMKRRGADRVVGIDNDGGYLAQARFAAEVCGLEIELQQLSVYEVGRLEDKFDVVLFMGVLYHLRHPLLALDLIHEHVAKETLVFQSMLRGSDDRGDPSNWWVPNRACVESMLRSAGFEVRANPEPEVFVCGYRPFPKETQAAAYAAKRELDL